MNMRRYISLLFVVLLPFSVVSQGVISDEAKFDGVKYKVECILSETPKIIVSNTETHSIYYSVELTQITHNSYVDFNPTIKNTLNKILSVQFLSQKHLILIGTVRGVYQYDLKSKKFYTVIKSEYDNDGNLKSFFRVFASSPDSIYVNKYEYVKTTIEDNTHYDKKEIMVEEKISYPLLK